MAGVEVEKVAYQRVVLDGGGKQLVATVRPGEATVPRVGLEIEHSEFRAVGDPDGFDPDELIEFAQRCKELGG